MDAKTRTEKLKEVSNKNPVQTGINLYYKGQSHTFNAYAIPLEYLIYNKYNGRISAPVKSYEREVRPLDPENPEDVKVIEKFLLESNEKRNIITRNDIRLKGQREYGVVTNDGRIIDGNRRASILNSLWRDESIPYEERSRFKEFIAVILPEDIDYSDLLYLEASIQLGEDEKVGYDPIAKYLKARDMKEAGISTKDIATAMSVDEDIVSNYLSVLKLMDEYLKYCKYPGIYTMLSKREDLFLTLNRWMTTYKNGRVSTADWAFESDDISDLKRISFDYIRAQYEGKEFRLLGNPKQGASVFKTEKAWTDFRDKHQNTIDHITNSEPTVESYRENNPDADITKLLEGRDKDWQDRVSMELTSNLQEAVNMAQSATSDNPVKQIELALSNISLIDETSSKFVQREVYIKLTQLQEKVSSMINSHPESNNGKD